MNECSIDEGFCSPYELQKIYPNRWETTILSERQAIQRILTAQDDRLLIVIGPCSIHESESALEYAERLSVLKSHLKSHLLIIMRAYFSKPRTGLGWKGLIHDPFLDQSFKMHEGLHLARQTLSNIHQLGLGVATEFLDTIIPQYLMDIVSWSVIGARTVSSQLHRELASWLPCPVGFKNSLEGNIEIAIEAIKTAKAPHHFISINDHAQITMIQSQGNPDGHLILRGGQKPNYNHIEYAHKALLKEKLISSIMVDCSHANSQKQPQRQIEVAQYLMNIISKGNITVSGIMLESYLIGGHQFLTPGQTLKYGQSITDACLNWEESKTLLYQFAESVEKRRKKF